MKINTCVALMPCVFLAAAYGFSLEDKIVFASSCLLLAVIFGLVIVSEGLKK